MVKFKQNINRLNSTNNFLQLKIFKFPAAHSLNKTVDPNYIKTNN